MYRDHLHDFAAVNRRALELLQAGEDVDFEEFEEQGYAMPKTPHPQPRSESLGVRVRAVCRRIALAASRRQGRR